MEGSQRSEVTPRRPAELEVDCATEEMNAPVTLTTNDVGAGGLFIKTEYPLEAGTRFGTRFDLGDGHPILAECEVAWVRTGPPESVPPPGMGVRFVALEAGDTNRLRGWITGEEAEEGQDSPRVTFRIEGLGQTVPGEFRASSEDGMSAVAELPFLRIGSAVQVTVDEPGVEGPRAGRIAWLVMEDNEENEGGPPRVRMGIHFDADAEAAMAAAAPKGTPSQPIPLTMKKPDGAAGLPVTTSLTMGVPEPTASAGGAVATPWELGSPADTAPARIAATRRRVRSRQGKGRIDVAQAWQTLRGHAAKNPRIALGAMAVAILLLIGLVSAVALSGGKKPAKAAKAKAAPVAAAPADQAPAGEPAAAPLPPTVANGAPAAGAAGAAPPPLPGDAANGRAVLASGPGVNADPGKVLANAKGGAAGDPTLKDPPADPEAAPKIHIYSLGKKLVVKLPTKGKPRSVKHYLLANPDGVVVDAAGAAAVLRPGRYGVKDPRVKFVKVLHRGKAARFIVYYGKGVKSPKMRLTATEDGINFVLTTAKGGPTPRLARRGTPRKAGAATRKGTAAPRGRIAKRGKATAPARGLRKLKAAPRRKTTRKRPVPKRRPAPIADAEE